MPTIDSMVSDNKKCPKCKGKMNKGTVMTPRYPRWVKGKPMTKFGYYTSDTHVYSYRCTDCGYLESYV